MFVNANNQGEQPTIRNHPLSSRVQLSSEPLPQLSCGVYIQRNNYF